MLALADASAFAEALRAEMPPRPEGQEQIVTANRSGALATRA
jgi:hypothetical protein